MIATRNKRTTRLLALWIVLVVGKILPAPVFGQPTSGWTATPVVQANGTVMRAPLKLPFSRHSKLALSIDTRWSNNYGFRPIEVTVTSPTATTVDHVVTVRLYSGWREIRVAQSLELPAGSTSASMRIAVPQYHSTGRFLWWDVWVDGVKDDDLSVSASGIASGFGGATSSAAGITFLAVAPSQIRGRSGGGQRALTAPNTLDFEVLSLWISEFPKRWIGYTCFDVVFLSWNDLQLLQSTNPVALEAMTRWVRTGGQLWVGEVGEKFEQIVELSKMFGLRNSMATAVRLGTITLPMSDSGDELSEANWQPVRFRGRFREGQVVTFLDITTGDTHIVREPDEIMRLQNDPNLVITEQQFDDSDENDRERRWPRSSVQWFVQQRLGLGVVRAFRDTSEVAYFSRGSQLVNPNAAMDDDGSNYMPRSLATALRSTDRWNARHGMEPDDVNRDFVNLLVPGVGLAPVTEFRVLITLFVLLIGPVNYWLLKRWRRLHLLVLTVPLAAVFLTASLFAYAVISDGFGTTVRVQSFTTLDQRTSEAACWARLSYYSGLAPSGGLRMPDDLVLYPINPAWDANNLDTNLGVERDLVWGDGEVWLSRGWLRSRTPTQYLTIRARKTPHRLELEAGSDKLRATNQLGTDIRFALVFDQAGQIWVGEELAAGARTFLVPIEREDAIRRFRQLVMDSEPEPPTALIGDDSHFVTMQRRQMRQLFRNRFGPQFGETRLTTSLINETLAELAGVAGKPALALPERSYVAVTATGPEVEVGMRGAQEEASFHVIVGNW